MKRNHCQTAFIITDTAAHNGTVVSLSVQLNTINKPTVAAAATAAVAAAAAAAADV